MRTRKVSDEMHFYSPARRCINVNVNQTAEVGGGGDKEHKDQYEMPWLFNRCCPARGHSDCRSAYIVPALSNSSASTRQTVHFLQKRHKK